LAKQLAAANDTVTQLTKEKTDLNSIVNLVSHFVDANQDLTAQLRKKFDVPMERSKE